MNKENTDFWLSLERERFDQSWKQKPQPYVPSTPTVVYVEKKETPKQRRIRDQLFFDAGRYQAGQRDAQATVAWNKLLRGSKNG